MDSSVGATFLCWSLELFKMPLLRSLRFVAVFFYKDVAPTELKQKAVNGYLFRNMDILPMFFLFLPCPAMQQVA